MKNKKIALQIFTGGFNEDKIRFDDFKEKLVKMVENIPVKKVIMGWSLNTELYRETKRLLEKYGIELYLWIPVFSEIGLLKNSIITRDYKEKEIRSYSLQEGESFEFYCPTSMENSLNFYDIFRRYFKDIKFDGIFLDKIRYGSFSNGIDGVFSCFCSNCQKAYKEKGLDIVRLKEEIEILKIGKKGYDTSPFNIIHYNRGKYRFSNQIWSDFFNIKSEIILERLTEFSNYFKNQGMKIGIDTFAPFLSYFVGQDLERMQELVDFNKPMMYRITQAPAGLPFETDCLIKESTNGEFGNIKNKFLNVIGAGEYDEKFPLEFIKNELKFISNKSTCNIYCGIEINRKKDIAKVYPDYIKENLIALNHIDIEGYVLSWDLISAPDENMDTVIDFFK